MGQKILFKIRVKTLEGRLLTFHNVSEYSNDNGLIEFVDSMNGSKKIFSANNCEIEVEK